MNQLKIVGVHPVDAPEPCYLIVIEFHEPTQDYDWGKVTQEEPGQPESNWQVAYDERIIDNTGKRWAFFFHYLNFNRPLLTPEGPMGLPNPAPLPEELRTIEYEPPY